MNYYSLFQKAWQITVNYRFLLILGAVMTSFYVFIFYFYYLNFDQYFYQFFEKYFLELLTKAKGSSGNILHYILPFIVSILIFFMILIFIWEYFLASLYSGIIDGIGGLQSNFYDSLKKGIKIAPRLIFLDILSGFILLILNIPIVVSVIFLILLQAKVESLTIWTFLFLIWSIYFFINILLSIYLFLVIVFARINIAFDYKTKIFKILINSRNLISDNKLNSFLIILIFWIGLSFWLNIVNLMFSLFLEIINIYDYKIFILSVIVPLHILVTSFGFVFFYIFLFLAYLELIKNQESKLINDLENGTTKSII